MTYDIRPLSFSEILDRAFRVLANNAVVIIGIAAVICIAQSLIYSTGHHIVALLFILAVAPLLQAALTTAITEIYLDRPITIASAYRSGYRVFFPFFGTCFLVYAGPLGGLLIWFGVFYVSPLIGGLLWLLVLGLGVPLTIYWLIHWSLIGPIMIAEHRFGPSALRRSSRLVEGVGWRTLGLLTAAAAIIQVPTAVFKFLWFGIPVLGPLLNGIAISVGTAYSAIALVLYYFDRRCRLEDFDLHLLAENIRSQTAAESPVATGTPSLG